MIHSNHFFQKARLFTASLIASFLIYTTALAETITIPAGTRIYVETNQDVVGKKKRTSVGQIVRASVWRDVIIDGQIIIKGGTPVLVRVDSIKGAKVAGIKGKMSLGAYETTLVDGTPVQLSGGYYKEGKGRIALVASLAGIVFLPLIFIKGKAAKLPSGTVFDAYIDRTVTVEVPGYKKSGRSIDLTSVLGQSFYAEVLYDELEAVEKPKVFSFAIQAPVGNSGEFIIDKVNGETIKALKLTANLTGAEEGMEFWHGEVDIKKLGKKFQKGINTFEIATTIEGERVATEIVLDIQM
jgi:hypothetical protein